MDETSIGELCENGADHPCLLPLLARHSPPSCRQEEPKANTIIASDDCGRHSVREGVGLRFEMRTDMRVAATTLRMRPFLSCVADVLEMLGLQIPCRIPPTVPQGISYSPDKGSSQYPACGRRSASPVVTRPAELHRRKAAPPFSSPRADAHHR